MIQLTKLACGLLGALTIPPLIGVRPAVQADDTDSGDLRFAESVPADSLTQIYEVDGVKYPWVSTFSYRGWCDFYQPKACDTAADGYVGDYSWAICDAAPCTELAQPPDPDRPLRCHCRVEDGPFVGTRDSCTGDNGGIISAMELSVWDFENDTWPFPMPGFDYIKGSCEPIGSDPLP